MEKKTKEYFMLDADEIAAIDNFKAVLNRMYNLAKTTDTKLLLKDFDALFEKLSQIAG